MALNIFNTLSGKKEIFEPIQKGKVKMYVCGVTPYDLSHVGHARSYVAFDVIRRSLEYLGFEVEHIQNFTDVDDKIIDRAKEQGLRPLDLSARFIDEYFKDLDALGVKRAKSYPRVSTMIEQIVNVVEALVNNDSAYVVEGDVYLDVSKKKDYGLLSRQSLEDLKIGARVKVDSKKRGPLDFVLWKKAKKGEISWPSPWGKGRPGWHIECSVMAIETLGNTIDIHGGGQDLIFPHHENETAQSELYTNVPFVKHWLHNGLVTVKGGKMSKSLGNFITIRELLGSYEPMSLRFFLLGAQYRRNLDYSERAIKDAEKGLERIKNTIFSLKNALNKAPHTGENGFTNRINKAKDDFKASLEDDFNTPSALAILFDFLRDVNVYLTQKPSKGSLETSLDFLLEMIGVFGLEFKIQTSEILGELVDLLIQLREEMRDKKDFESADRIRDELSNLGIIIEDKREGTVWRFSG